MQNLARQMHVNPQEIEISTDECINEQMTIDLDKKIELC